ncbi:hypothetical protein CE91St5_05670 [Parabacteroides distasonis]|nr:hypothetical protein CE91St4_05670 [Parabacteroides distasonis]GKH88222.1 hypothetical protein CE91St5_05670 [Parabacteroides distasonis]
MSYSEHAINTKLFFPDTQKEKLFTTVAWMGGEGNVKRKGVDKALRIFAELKKMPAFADFKFIIMGRKGEGTTFVQSIINKYDLNDSVELKGEVSEEDKINLLKRSKYYFQLSLYEGFGLAALEALCADNILIHSGKGGLANSIYANQILFDIDKEFEDEYLKLCDRLSFPMNRKNNDTDINCYDIKRRKDDFRLIIVEGKSNYRLENL